MAGIAVAVENWEFWTRILPPGVGSGFSRRGDDGAVFRELSVKQFPSVVPMFPHKHELPALAVLTGQFPGRVFVDGPGTPTVAMVWVSGRWFYITGTVSSKTPHRFGHFLRDVVHPLRREEGWFEMSAPDDAHWDRLLRGVSGVAGVDKHSETMYTLDLNKFRAFLDTGRTVLDGVRVILTEQLTSPVVGKDAEPGSSLAAEVRRGQAVLAVCRDWLRVGREYFIEVDTFDPSERQKGFATLAARTLICQTLENGDSPPVGDDGVQSGLSEACV